MNIREFEEHDWDGFAGAECWSDGTQPLAADEGEFFFVADPNAVCVCVPESWGLLNDALQLDIHCVTPAAARAYLNGLTGIETLEEFKRRGFVEV